MGIKRPPGYIHPKKRNQSSRSQPLANELVATPRAPKKKEEAKPATRSSPDHNKVLLRLAAFPPASGEVRLFDEMIASGLTDKEAILGLFRRGTRKLSVIAEMQTPQNKGLIYERRGEATETNRSISEELFQQLRSNIDPFEAMTSRALGLKIGELIIALVAQDHTRD